MTNMLKLALTNVSHSKDKEPVDKVNILIAEIIINRIA